MADSFDIFESGVEEVRLLLALKQANLRSNDATPDSGSSKESSLSFDSAQRVDLGYENVIHRASVVLLVSHFEAYLKSLAQEFVDLFDTGNVESRVIPSGIRELHAMPRITQIAQSGDANQRHSLLRKLSETAALWNDLAKVSKGTLRGDLLAKKVTSARVDKINGLFELMGSSDDVCAGGLDVTMDSGDLQFFDIRMTLEDLVGCRNDIAHGDYQRIPTIQDVDRYITFLVAFSGRLRRRWDQLVPVPLQVDTRKP